MSLKSMKLRIAIGVALILMSLSLFLIQYVYEDLNSPFAITHIQIGVAAGFALWIWMFMDYIQRELGKHKVLWGLGLLFLNWPFSIIYFAAKYILDENDAGIDKEDLTEKHKPVIIGYLLLAVIFSPLVAILLIPGYFKGDVFQFHLAISLLCAFSLWPWMIIDFFKRKDKIRSKEFWGIGLVFFNWVCAIFYFMFVYSRKPANNI